MGDGNGKGIERMENGGWEWEGNSGKREIMKGNGRRIWEGRIKGNGR